MVALSTAATTAAASEICVIGAGAAGLVTARHLLQAGLRPTLLEASHEMGGLWRTTSGSSSSSNNNNQQQHDPSRRTWNSMRTNLSRYTCCFSDYPWSMVQSNNNHKATANNHHDNALSFFFPTVEQMHEYLKSYSQHYLMDNDNNNNNVSLRLGCQVTKVTPLDNFQKYAVEWQQQSPPGSKADASQQQQVFDGVVVASGFFSEPSWPSATSLSGFTGTHVHSSQYQSLEDLLKNDDNHHQDDENNEAASTVAVCGASFSALEIAVDLARSTASQSQQQQRQRRVVHIAPSLPWVAPRFLHDVATTTTASTTQNFIPIDLALYRRWNGGLKDQEQVLGNDPEANAKKHDMLKRFLGTHKQRQVMDQACPGMPYPWDDPTQPTFVSISDDYLDLVQSGRIEIVPGRLDGCDEATGALRVKRSGDNKGGDNDDATTLVENVQALVSATGYHTNLDFLDPSILKTLQYDKSNKFAPLILCDDVYHPELPNLAFVNMYRGPYFGVMELQARLAVCRLLSDDEENKDNNRNLVEEDQKALEDARQIREQSPQPQFPRSDLVGRMDALATKLQRRYPSHHHGLGSHQNVPHMTQQGSVVLPIQYQPDEKLAMTVVEEMNDELQLYCTSAAHVTSRLLQSLIGTYKFDRTLTQLSNGSKQFVSGKIQFSLQQRQLGKEDGDYEEYVLYREDGVMELPNGQPIEVFREYHYLLNPSNGALEIFFVEAGERAHLFLSLLFENNEMNDSDSSSSSVSSFSDWVARNDHLCIKDLYDAEFRVSLEGLSARHVQMKYKVKGPAKDYEALTILFPV